MKNERGIIVAQHRFRKTYLCLILSRPYVEFFLYRS